MTDRPSLAALEPFIGEWAMTAEWPDSTEFNDVAGRCSFEWLLGDTFLVQRSSIDHPAAPDAYSVVHADAERDGDYVMHYFDSRGVVRICRMTFDGRVWTLTRTEPDFTSLEFAQRYVGTLSDDGRTIDGQWEMGDKQGENWRLDFKLRYTRL